MLLIHIILRCHLRYIIFCNPIQSNCNLVEDGEGVVLNQKHARILSYMSMIAVLTCEW